LLALIPAIVAALFAAMALDDAGVIGALPYLSVVLLNLLYFVRPMLILWAPAFAAFLVYTAIILVNPLVDPGNGPFTDWVLFLTMGFVPTVLLWFSRPLQIPRGDASVESNLGGTFR
jgi:hypothetical protein